MIFSCNISPAWLLLIISSFFLTALDDYSQQWIIWCWQDAYHSASMFDELKREKPSLLQCVEFLPATMQACEGRSLLINNCPLLFT